MGYGLPWRVFLQRFPNKKVFIIWVFPKITVPPNHPFVHRVLHEINHPFWGTPIFGNTHIKKREIQLFSALLPPAVALLLPLVFFGISGLYLTGQWLSRSSNLVVLIVIPLSHDWQCWRMSSLILQQTFSSDASCDPVKQPWNFIQPRFWYEKEPGKSGHFSQPIFVMKNLSNLRQFSTETVLKTVFLLAWKSSHGGLCHPPLSRSNSHGDLNHWIGPTPRCDAKQQSAPLRFGPV